MSGFIEQIVNYGSGISLLEFGGLLFGLLCVYFLIKENILTWPCGIIYVLISFYVFWNARLYGDFLLHVVFLLLNIHGWRLWLNKNSDTNEELQVTSMNLNQSIKLIILTMIGIVAFAQLLIYAPHWVGGMPDAALPYWDSTTSILSVTGIYLTTIKKIENWYYWLVVDILATGIYYYKEIYFYSFLYFIYIGLAIAGYIAWRKSMISKQIA